MGKIKVRLKYTQMDGRSTFEIGYTKLHYFRVESFVLVVKSTSHI